MSVIELMVAMVLLSVGLMGLSGLSLTVTTQYRNAGRQAFAAAVVQSRLDSLSSVTCLNLAPSGTQSGVAVTRGVTERWKISDGNDVKVILDSVSFSGRKRPLVYTSIIPCRD